MVPEAMQKNNALPDCIIKNTQTGNLRGVEFKHFGTKYEDNQFVKPFQYPNCSYEILTKDSFKPHYNQYSFVSKVYSYSDIQKECLGIIILLLNTTKCINTIFR